MIRTRPFRRQEQKHQIDRLVVQRLEIDRRFQAGEDTGDALHAGELAMRNGDAVADTGRAQPLTLQDGVEQAAEVEEMRWLDSDVPHDITVGSISQHEIIPRLKARDLID